MATLFLVLLLALFSIFSPSLGKDWDPELCERMADMCVSHLRSKKERQAVPGRIVSMASFHSCSVSRYLPGSFTVEPGYLADLFENKVKPLCQEGDHLRATPIKPLTRTGLPDKEFQGYIPAPGQKRPDLAYCQGKNTPHALSYPNRTFHVVETFGGIKACLYICPANDHSCPI
jgi:hypothetical protein